MNEEFDFDVWWKEEGIYIFIEAGETKPFIVSAVKQVMEEQYAKGFKSGRDAQRESDAEIASLPASPNNIYDMIKNNTGEL